MDDDIKTKIAKIIRVLSIPPIMVLLLLVLLTINRFSIFKNIAEVVILYLLLGVIPICAYPLSRTKKYKDQGREGQRKLAFVLNLFGYFFATVYSIFNHSSQEVMLITFSYFVAVLLLAYINACTNIRASGHACSFASPIFLTIIFLGKIYIIPGFVIGSLVIWASLYLKRHTIKDIWSGIIISFVSISIFYLMLVFI